MKNINLIGLNKNFETVGLIYYTNLQWSRKYYESGTFSIEIPLSKYNKEIKYLYTKDRPEMAVVNQVNYIVKRNSQVVNLSGYFLEHELDRRVVYKLGTSNIVNAPSWNCKTGKAEDVATDFFNDFKNLTFNYNGEQVTSQLNIVAATSQGRGKNTRRHRYGEYLGKQIYSILKVSKMSFRVVYDFVNDTQTFKCWSGRDLTTGNEVGNNPVIFSTKYNNVESVNLLLNDSEYCNSYIATNSATDETNAEIVDIQVGSLRTADETSFDDSFLSVETMLSKSSYASTDEFIQAMNDEARSKTNDAEKTINLEFKAIEGSYEYMVDFDLGDTCSIEIPELQLSADATLIAIYEVIKAGVHTITLEFGTPLIKGGVK